MKIAVDIQPLLSGNKTGIGFYQTEIMNAISDIDRENEYFLNFFSLRNTENKKAKAERLFNGLGKVNICEWFSYGIAKKIWYLLPIPYRLFFPEKTDVNLFFNYYVPPFAEGKSVVVIYDTVVNDLPETMGAKTQFALKHTLKKSIKRAEKIITISEFSKERIMYHYRVPEEKISVVPCGYRSDIFHSDYEKTDIEAVKKKYGIEYEYFLYLGTLEPRKNIERLIKARELLKKDFEDCPKLVLAGGKGWLYDGIFELVKNMNLENSVIFTGYVEDNDVPLLMSGATAFCFPSLYEGFGMPPLEAMACGVPVIASDISSLPEVVGDAALLVDPLSVDSIAEALKKIAFDKELRSELSKKGLSQCKKFSWKQSAELFFHVIKKL